jgi:hypothetical protein
MFDWKQRLLEIGLAGGLAASGASCGQDLGQGQPAPGTCMNCCGSMSEPAHLANSLDENPPTTTLVGCALPPKSPPAPYGTPANGSVCLSDPDFGSTVAIDDLTLGYSPQEVLDAANAGSTASLTWWDGTTTRLRFRIDPSPDTLFFVEVNPPNANYCDRATNILHLVATLETDDGRLAEQLPANISVRDRGQRFEIADINLDVNLASGQRLPSDLKGTLATDIRAWLPPETSEVVFALSVLMKGAACLPYCAPGAVPQSGGPLGNQTCFVPSGLITVYASYGTDSSAAFCGSNAYAASWQWD